MVNTYERDLFDAAYERGQKEALDKLYARAPAMFDEWWDIVEEVFPEWKPK